MAGGRELADAPKIRSTANETGNKLHWEREGNKAKLTAGKDGVDGGSGKTATWTVDGSPRSSSVRQLWPGRGENGAGSERETRGGARLRLKRSRGTRGGALPRRQGGGCGLAT